MRFAKASIILALTCFSGFAMAGTKFSTPVYIGSGYFHGGLSTARYSANSIEYIYCDMQQDGFVQCVARDASGAAVSCTTNASAHPNIVPMLAAMNSDSALFVYWDPATGACSWITVRNGSVNLP